MVHQIVYTGYNNKKERLVKTMIRNKTNIKNIKSDDEYIEIPFSFILEVLLVSFILLKTSGAFVSFTAFGSIIIIRISALNK